MKREVDSPPPVPSPAIQEKESPKRSLFGIGKKSWVVVNCLTGEQHAIEKFPFEIGSADAVDLRLPNLPENHCALVETKRNGICLDLRDFGADTVLNGQRVTAQTPLPHDTDFSLHVGEYFFLLRGGRDVEKWATAINLHEWLIYHPQTQQTEGPIEWRKLPALAASRDLDPRATVLFPSGSNMGFYLWQLSEVLGKAGRPAGSTPSEAETAAGGSVMATAADRGELLCPVCWSRFDKGDVMHIASHESLRGDPVLGEDAMLRFQATRYNNQGQGLDAVGLPCPDIACPHCRRKLPPGFMDIPHRIISLVGETSAGKSYYLSVAAKVLPEVLFRSFNVVFKDADPTGNRHLNAMKNRLFSGATPEQVRLEKTQAQGDLYERVMVHGQETRLPMPFMFSVSPARDGHSRQGVVFYDLAGELFQPGVSDYDAMKTQHVAVASTVLFLFDPTLNRGFRSRLAGHSDPQLQSRQLDQQDTLLAEMEVRVKRMLNLDGRSRVKTPLAILIGKCDIWLPMLGASQLEPVVGNDGLDLAALQRNSQRLRTFLSEVVPNVVANAESLAEDVAYFAVSSFGHSPVRLPDGNLAPDPQKLHPQNVEQPFLWAMAKTMPHLLRIKPAD